MPESTCYPSLRTVTDGTSRRVAGKSGDALPAAHDAGTDHDSRRIGVPADSPVRATVGAPLFVRILFGTAGVLCVALGALGAVLPGLPTTVFLITASFLFLRSFPRLEQSLVRHRLFKSYIGYLDGSKAMPRKAQLTALSLMWINIIASVVVLRMGNSLPLWLIALPPFGGVIGTYAIWRAGRPKA